MTEEEIEIVARAIETSLFNEHDSHGCRAEGPRDGKDMTIHGHINLPALGCAVLAALDQHREGKDREPLEEEPSGPLGMRFTPLG